nr:FYDLN acid domain-containing protein [uncultured Holophaga sp.]
MANLGKKWICFSCSAKFYDFGKSEALCPKCGTNQKDAPAKPKAGKKEKVALPIEDDFGSEGDMEGGEDGIVESFGISGARAEGVDPGDLNMDDYDE